MASNSPTSDGLDEGQLLDALRRGDDDAYERIVRELGPRMLAVARRFVRQDDEAEDIVQEAFIQAFKNIERFEGGSKLSTWMHRITVNAALMRLRKKSRRMEVAIEDLLPSYSDDGHRAELGEPWTERGEDVAIREETRALVRQSIDRLPDSYRNVLMLRDIEQLDTAETAETLGITVNATKTRLHRARQALRELLDPHLQGGGVA
jgi:RNA polymerase sigma-70 factor (ECF subfamily)